MPIVLTPRERAHLKARAHPLEPRVQIGHGGLTASVLAEVDRALTAHELVKVKILGGDRERREAIGTPISTRPRTPDPACAACTSCAGPIASTAAIAPTLVLTLNSAINLLPGRKMRPLLPCDHLTQEAG